MITVDDEPVGAAPRRLRPDRGHGPGHLQRAAARASGSSGRPAPFVRIAMLDPDGDELAPGETGEIGVRGPDGDERLLQPPRAQRSSARPAAGTTPTTSAASRPTGRSPSSAPRPGSSSRRPRTSTRPRWRAASSRTRRGRRGGHRRARPDLGPERDGRGGAARRRRRPAADDIIEHCRERIASYKKPKRSSSSTRSPAQGWAVDYDALDATYGGGGYPGTGG